MMSNIHGLADYRNQGSAPAPRQRTREMGGNQYQQPVDDQEAEATGISLSAPPENGAVVASIREQIFPRFKWKSFTWFISVVDIVMMIAILIVGQVNFGAAFVKGNSMAGPGTECLQYMGGKKTDLIQHGEFWRLATPIILHAGLLHLFMNLLFQLHFGFTFELRWGLWRFIGVYIVAGVGASLMSSVVTAASVSVGASGALFGLLGADFTYLIMNWVDIPGNKQEMCVIVFVIVINFVFGSIGPAVAGGDNTVDWAAHLGGLLTGMFCASFLTPVIFPTSKTSCYKWTGVGCYVGFTALLAILLFTNTVHY